MKMESFKKEWNRLKAEAAFEGNVVINKSATWTKSWLVSKGVSNGHGIYVFYGLRDIGKDELLYVGMSGTATSNGKMGDQGIAGRLANKAFTVKKQVVKKMCLLRYLINGAPANETKINKLIDDRFGLNQGLYDQIRIEWIETYVSGQGILPRLAEALLLSAYILENRDFPPLNKEL